MRHPEDTMRKNVEIQSKLSYLLACLPTPKKTFEYQIISDIETRMRKSPFPKCQMANKGYVHLGRAVFLAVSSDDACLFLPNVSYFPLLSYSPPPNRNTLDPKNCFRNYYLSSVHTLAFRKQHALI